ncbi:hypothetical protein CBM2626_B60089 [Cupriavidus taiwanensis]|nr:hypothetical protein CBM2626_B60089 [Cupriavidus taiwanensis]
MRWCGKGTFINSGFRIYDNEMCEAMLHREFCTSQQDKIFRSLSSCITIPAKRYTKNIILNLCLGKTPR